MAGGTTWTLQMTVMLTLLTRSGLLCHPRISSASTDNWSHPFLHLRKSLKPAFFSISSDSHFVPNISSPVSRRTPSPPSHWKSLSEVRFLSSPHPRAVGPRLSWAAMRLPAARAPAPPTCLHPTPLPPVLGEQV